MLVSDNTFLSGGTPPLDIAEITHVQGSGNYSLLHLANGKTHLLSYPIFRFEPLFPGFLRTHKGFLVNPDYITMICSHKQRYLVLKSGKQLPVSRRRITTIAKKLNSVPL